MERHLDFTIDFETCGLSANAAVMQVAVAPWVRDKDDSPFLCFKDVAVDAYVGYVDLRTCVVDGFDFDQQTVDWWSQRSAKAKEAVCMGKAEPVSQVLVDALDYIRDYMAQLQLESICLWCQGPDLDIAVLKNLCRKYDVNLDDIMPHTSFRDCRTVILEAALLEAERSMDGTGTRANGIALPSEILRNPSLAYKFYSPLPEEYANYSEAHDARYDAVRSSWLTWQALKWLRGSEIKQQ